MKIRKRLHKCKKNLQKNKEEKEIPVVEIRIIR